MKILYYNVVGIGFIIQYFISYHRYHSIKTIGFAFLYGGLSQFLGKLLFYQFQGALSLYFAGLQIFIIIDIDFLENYIVVKYKWRPRWLSELSLIIFDMGLTHFGLEASNFSF